MARCEDGKGLIPSDDSDFDVQSFRQLVGNGVGVWFGAGTADDNFHSVTGGIDEAAVTRRERDREQVGITRCTKGQSIAFRVGG